jgi:nuclear pore complex protein Nup214
VLQVRYLRVFLQNMVLNPLVHKQVKGCYPRGSKLHFALETKVPFYTCLYLAGSNQQESMDVKNSSLVSKEQETTGNSLLTSSDKKPLDTKQLNVTAALTTAPSLALTGNTKPAMSFSFSTVNNEGKNPTGSKAPSGLAPFFRPGSSSFGNSQSGKGGLDSTQSVGTFGGSQNSNKDGGGYSFKSSFIASSGSVPAKIGERNEACFGNPSPQTSYTADGKVFGPPVALSPGPLPSISPAKPSLIGSSSSGYRAGNSEAPHLLHGSPLSQQTMGKSHNSRTQAPVDYARNSKMSAIFDSQEDVSKKFYSVRSLNAFNYYLFFSFTCTYEILSSVQGKFQVMNAPIFCCLLEHHPNIFTYFGIFFLGD